MELIGYAIAALLFILMIWGAASKERDSMQRTDDLRAIREQMEGK